MNKNLVRSFSLGMFASVSLIGSIYYFSGANNSSSVSLSEAKTLVSDKGYVVLKEKEYNDLLEGAVQKDTNTDESTNTEKNTEKESTETAAPAPAVVNYQLVVSDGMTSSEIASVLFQNKIVNDEWEFQQYLVNTGYHTNVQLGTYDLTSTMSFEEIAKVITKS